jgi:hypothetical protein
MNTLRRHPVVWIALGAIVGIILITISITKQLDTSDGLDGAGFGVTVGTLLLALLGAALAVLAFAQSVRHPRLRVEVQLDMLTFDDPSTGEVRAKPLEEVPPELLSLGASYEALSHMYVRVGIRNYGDATARNVTVTVELLGMITWLGHTSLGTFKKPEGWTILDDGGVPSYRFQWDGGADLAVHPDPAPGRDVPPILLWVSAAETGATVRAVAMAYADGCAPTKHTFEITVGNRNPDGTNAK